MNKIKWPGATLTMPVPPTLVTCGTMENPNALTIAWTGIINSQPPKTYISVRPERYSYDIIKESGEFVINMPTATMVRAIDYCGCRSGKDEDKLKAMGLTAIECEGSSCPQIAESPIALTCKVTEIVKLGSHDMFLADITGVIVDESLLDKKGKLQIEKAGLIAYAHGQYFELGKKIGSFGFSVQKNNNQSRRNDVLTNEAARHDAERHEAIKRDVGRIDPGKGYGKKGATAGNTRGPAGSARGPAGKGFGKVASNPKRTSKSFGADISAATTASSAAGKGYGATGTRVSDNTGKSFAANKSKASGGLKLYANKGKTGTGYQGKGNKK